jgi:hypothetical protein
MSTTPAASSAAPSTAAVAISAAPAAESKPTPKPQQAGKKAPYELTPEQRAKQAARAQLKQAKQAAAQAEGAQPLRSAEQLAKGEFRKRDWVRLDEEAGPVAEGELRVKVMSWNVSGRVRIRPASCSWYGTVVADPLGPFLAAVTDACADARPCVAVADSGARPSCLID